MNRTISWRSQPAPPHCPTGIIRQTFNVAANAGVVADITCPTDKVATGGGFCADPSAFDTDRDSPAFDATQPGHWDVYGHNYTNEAKSVDVYAVCVSG